MLSYITVWLFSYRMIEDMSYIKLIVWKLYPVVQYNVYCKCGKYNCISVGKSNNVRSVCVCIYIDI